MNALYDELFYAALIVLASFIVAKLAYYLVKRHVHRLTRMTETTLDDEILKAVEKPIYIAIVLAGIYLALRSISYVDPYSNQIHDLLSTLGIVVLAYTSVRVVNVILSWYSSSIMVKTTIPLDDKFMPVLRNFASVFIYGMMLLVILHRLGYEITPLVASLGIAGLAVGLALQDTLTNFFAGFYLFVDKPIGIGDYVELDNNVKGYVEVVGWRSTKIKTLLGYYIVVPNAKLAQGVITNYHTPEKEISVTIPVSVSYGSDLDKVERVTTEVARKILETTPGGVKGVQPFIRYNEFQDSGIKFSVILRVEQFVDQYLVKHEFIKALVKGYREEGIEIPYPTRTVHMKRDST